jgi:hypothetical protein
MASPTSTPLDLYPARPRNHRSLRQAPEERELAQRRSEALRHRLPRSGPPSRDQIGRLGLHPARLEQAVHASTHAPALRLPSHARDLPLQTLRNPQTPNWCPPSPARQPCWRLE